MGEFSDRVALVTGSTSGIGEATAKRLVALGAKVMLNSSTSSSEGERLASELEGASYHQADISSENECKKLVDATIETFGRLDVLVNNAARDDRHDDHHDDDENGRLG